MNQRGTALVSGNAMMVGGNANYENLNDGARYAKEKASKKSKSSSAKASKDVAKAQEEENKALEEYLKKLQLMNLGTNPANFIGKHIGNLIPPKLNWNVNPSGSSTPNISIGDIHLSVVQNMDNHSKAIINQLPGAILQKLHK